MQVIPVPCLKDNYAYIINDKDSIKGNNVRGVYWTIADESGKEVKRDI